MQFRFRRATRFARLQVGWARMSAPTDGREKRSESISSCGTVARPKNLAHSSFPPHRFVISASYRWAAVLVCASLAGCGGGDGRMNTKGRVWKGGQPYTVPEGDYLRVTFYELSPDGANGKNSYAATCAGAPTTKTPRRSYSTSTRGPRNW